MGQKTVGHEKKLEDTNVLIPWYPISYLTIASSGFFFGRLRVPTRRCDLVVPADWGWGRSIEYSTILILPAMILFFLLSPWTLLQQSEK